MIKTAPDLARGFYARLNTCLSLPKFFQIAIGHLASAAVSGTEYQWFFIYAIFLLLRSNSILSCQVPSRCPIFSRCPLFGIRRINVNEDWLYYGKNTCLDHQIPSASLLAI